MKIQRLYEDRGLLDESPSNESSIIITETLYRDIVDKLNIKTHDRGDTTLRVFICEIIGVNHNQYELHHINGNHDDNSPENLALIPRGGRGHNAIHQTVSRIISNDKRAKELFDNDKDDELVDLLHSHFKEILSKTDGVILVIDELRKKGLKR
jgi:hypothetical protein